ncbi:MAG TPA: DNA-processing protein DprA [Rhodothermales bacterium]|nr:DNA-processing protein DprA [Rhodothermales bacterium]
MPDTTTFAYALHLMPGVGRVTAHRLLRHFATYEDLLRYPREQVLVRIKGAPNAEALVARLFDRPAMGTLFSQAEEDIAQLAQRRVDVTAPGDPLWPAQMEQLPPSERPTLLYTYGDRHLLSSRPLLGLFARPPVPGPEYELVQELVQALLPLGAIPVTGASSGFDVVFHKLAAAQSRPSMLVAACGLGKLPTPLRPTASATVKAGGLLVSGFPLVHGPYEHDDRERAVLQAAFAKVCIFVCPRPGTPEQHALDWALSYDCPIFVMDTSGTSIPDGATAIDSEGHFELVRHALGLNG